MEPAQKAALLEWDSKRQLAETAIPYLFPENHENGFIVTYEMYEELVSIKDEYGVCSPNNHAYLTLDSAGALFFYVICQFSDTEVGRANAVIHTCAFTALELPMEATSTEPAIILEGAMTVEDALERFANWQNHGKEWLQRNEADSGIFQAFHLPMADLAHFFKADSDGHINEEQVSVLIALRTIEEESDGLELPELITFRGTNIYNTAKDITYPVPPFKPQKIYDLLTQAGIAY